MLSAYKKYIRISTIFRSANKGNKKGQQDKVKEKMMSPVNLLFYFVDISK